MAQFQFDTTGREAMQSFGALPPGRYSLIVTDAEIKDAKSGKGSYLLVISEVTTGEHEGRKLFDRFNIVHENKTAVEIGEKQLTAFLQAIGLVLVKDTDELLDREFDADLKIERSNDMESNKVAAYLPHAGAGAAFVAPKSQPAPAKPAAAPAANKVAPAWAKKAS